MNSSKQSLTSRIEAARQRHEAGELETYAVEKETDEGRTNSWGPANRV